MCCHFIALPHRQIICFHFLSLPHGRVTCSYFLPFAPQANHVMSLSFLASQANYLHFLSSSFFLLSLVLLFFANTDMAYSLRQISFSLFFFRALQANQNSNNAKNIRIHTIDKTKITTTRNTMHNNKCEA